ncbi:hypothetical protein HD553DRAFT_191871 [Filobasidium floriforme]|uniref:uncharacterized protein n=1 Tax=Filobasidium floriforme TaxID=5210 RepID=UPI001E8D4669|nr:uncharacterized protein HD553DRAFT_191871 [Filobasidium floriforme]KAH8088197.1 hypothetical protein HD553DRAFT_191871 [Filobasidium floriforme]
MLPWTPSHLVGFTYLVILFHLLNSDFPLALLTFSLSVCPQRIIPLDPLRSGQRLLSLQPPLLILLCVAAHNLIESSDESHNKYYLEPCGLFALHISGTGYISRLAGISK